jgi:hypothetical protein
MEYIFWLRLQSPLELLWADPPVVVGVKVLEGLGRGQILQLQEHVREFDLKDMMEEFEVIQFCQWPESEATK